MNVHVLWAIVIGFLAGVFARSLLDLSWPFAAFVFFLAAVLAALAYFQLGKRSPLLVTAVALMACGVGVMRMDMAALRGDPQLTRALGEEVTIEGFVIEEPDARERNIRLTVEVNRLVYQNATSTADQRILVIAPAYSDATYGMQIRATGVLELPEPFDTDSGRPFDYPMFLAKDGILYVLAFSEIEDLGDRKRNPLKAAALWIKHAYLDGLHRALPEPESGLAGGITVGDKRSIGEDLSEIFRQVSLIHMVVLSGYNITVVINALVHVIGWAGQSVKFGVSGVVVAFFILATGGAASAVRAGSMALIAIFARMTGRVFLALRILGVVAFAMVLWNPYVLLFDPGFQLSILATLGLILFTPVFEKRLQWIPERLALREIAASTMGTQLAVLPLLLYQNGQLSLYALPANMLALTAVPVAMLGSFVASVAGLLFGQFAAIIAFPAYILLAYIIKIAQLFASLPFASITIAAFSAWWMIAAYTLLFGSFWYFKKV